MSNLKIVWILFFPILLGVIFFGGGCSKSLNPTINNSSDYFTAGYWENDSNFFLFDVYTNDYRVEIALLESKVYLPNTTVEIGKRVCESDTAPIPNLPFYPEDFYIFPQSPFLGCHYYNIESIGSNDFYPTNSYAKPIPREWVDTTKIFWLFPEDFRWYSISSHQMEYAGKEISVMDDIDFYFFWESEYFGSRLDFKTEVVDDVRYINRVPNNEFDLTIPYFENEEIKAGYQYKWNISDTKFQIDISPQDSVNIMMEFILHEKPCLKKTITTNSSGISANFFNEDGLLEAVFIKTDTLTEIYHYDVADGWLLRKETIVTNNPTSCMVTTFKVEREYETQDFGPYRLTPIFSDP